MPSSDGTGSASSQKLKPKLSKPNLKSVGSEKPQSERAAKTDGSVSKKSKAPGESALIKVAGGDGAVSGKKKAVKSEGGGSTSAKSPKLSGKAPAAAAENTAGSSTALKVKKKTSSTTGKALNPKKSSLRKTAPVDDEPIKATDDLEPVSDELDEVEEADDLDDADDADAAGAEKANDDADGVTETYVLNAEDEKAAETAEKSKQSGDEDDLEADEATTGDEAGEGEGDDEKKPKKGKKDSGAGKPAKGLKSSKRTGATGDAAADAKTAERNSKRAAGHKKANRFHAILFLFFAIGTVVLLIACGIVVWVKWGNRPKEELNVYAVPAIAGESFERLQSDFTKEANSDEFLAAQNPDLPKDKPFEKDVRVKVNIPRSWTKLSSDTSFVQHFLAAVDNDLKKKPADLAAAHRDLLQARQMLKRFILNVSTNTEETRKKWQKDVDEVANDIAKAEKDAEGGGDAGGGGTPPTGTGEKPAPGTTPDTAPSGEIDFKKLRRLNDLCNPVNSSVMQAHTFAANGKKEEAVAELKKALDTIEKLKAITDADAKEAKVIDTIKKAEKIQPLFDKGQGISAEDIEAAFPDTKPQPVEPGDIPDGPTEAK